MRCLPHVFLRAALALLLLAGVGVGAWSLPAACHPAQAAIHASAPRAHC